MLTPSKAESTKMTDQQPNFLAQVFKVFIGRIGLYKRMFAVVSYAVSLLIWTISRIYPASQMYGSAGSFKTRYRSHPNKRLSPARLYIAIE